MLPALLRMGMLWASSYPQPPIASSRLLKVQFLRVALPKLELPNRVLPRHRFSNLDLPIGTLGVTADSFDLGPASMEAAPQCRSPAHTVPGSVAAAGNLSGDSAQDYFADGMTEA